MIKNTTGLHVKLVFLSLIVLSFLIFFLYQFQFIPQQRKIVTDISIEKSKTIFNISTDQLDQAIKNTDDLSLISRIENIAKISDVKNVYIIDTDGKVLTHNNTAEWGKIYDDPLSKKAITANKYCSQEIKFENSYFFSKPINSTYTLCISLSAEKIKKEASRMKTSYFYASLLVLLISGLIFAGFIHYIVVLPLRKIENSLESALLSKNGKLPKDENRDFEKLVDLINKILSGSGPSQNDHMKTETNTLINLFQEAIKYFNKGIAIFDHDNRVISANKKAAEFLLLKKETIENKHPHILDLDIPSKLLEMFKNTESNTNKTYNDTVNGKKITLIAVPTKNGNSAGIILIVD